MNPSRVSFPPGGNPTQDVTIEAEGGLHMTFDDSIRASLGPVGDPMFVSTGRKIRRDMEDSLLSSQMSLASAQSTSSLGILQLDSMGDLSGSFLHISDAFLDGKENGTHSGQENPEPGVRGKASGLDSFEASEIDTDDELQAVLQENARRALYPVTKVTDRQVLQAGDGGESSSDDTRLSRPGLEGGSSEEEEDKPPSASIPYPRQELRQSAEGGTLATIGGVGDGMSDGETGSSMTAPSVVSGGPGMARTEPGSRRVCFRSWSSQSGVSDQERNVEGSVLSDPMQTPTPEMSRLDPHFLLPSAHPPSGASLTDPTSPELRPLSTASSFHFDEGMFGSSQEGPLHSLGDGRRGNGIGDDEEHEKTLIGGDGEGWSASLAEFEDFESNLTKKGDVDPSQGAFANVSRHLVDGHSPQGAYNPFDSVDNGGAGNFPAGNFSEFDIEFTPLDDAEAVLEEDQKEFERENKFRQDEYISSDQFSCEWTLPNESHLTSKRPEVSYGEENPEDRVSFGEFMRTRTEALGSLSGDYAIKRPSFGTGHIKTPESKEPVALVESSRLSLVSEEQEAGERGLKAIPLMSDLGESIRFAGVGSDTEDSLAQPKFRDETTVKRFSDIGEDSLSFADVDSYCSSKTSLPMASLYLRAADPEGSASNEAQHKPRLLSRSDSDKPSLSLSDLRVGDETLDSGESSGFLKNEAGDMEETIIAETPETSWSDRKGSPPKPNLRVQPFQGATPALPKQIRHLREESEPDGTKTPPIDTSSIAAAIINASSCTKPEELAAMIVALSNKNRKMEERQASQANRTEAKRPEPNDVPSAGSIYQVNSLQKSPRSKRMDGDTRPELVEGISSQRFSNKMDRNQQSPNSNRVDVDTRPRLVAGPSNQGFPNKVDASHQPSPKSPRGRSGLSIEKIESNVPRAAGNKIPLIKSASEGHSRRTQPSGTDSEPQRSRADSLLTRQSFKSKSMQVPSPQPQQDSHAEKSQGSRLRGTSNGSLQAAQDHRSQEIRRPPSQTVFNKSVHQIDGTEANVSNNDSSIKEPTLLEMSYDSRLKVHYQCVEMLMKAQEMERGAEEAGMDSDTNSQETHRYSSDRTASSRREKNVAQSNRVRDGYSSDEESIDASMMDLKSRRLIGKERRKKEMMSKAKKVDSDPRNAMDEESSPDTHPIRSKVASPKPTPTHQKSSLSPCSGSSLSESATQTMDDETKPIASSQTSLPPVSVSFGPPIASFQAFPRPSHVSTCTSSSTPTLLTSQSLLTDALLKQYLNEQAVTSRPPSTLTVAPSYVSGQLMRSLDTVQTTKHLISPTAVNIPPSVPSLGLTQPLTIHTGQTGTSLNQLQSQDPSFPSNPSAASHQLLRSTHDLGPMLDRVSAQGQVGPLDAGVPSYPLSATVPAMPQTSGPGVPGLSHLSATGLAGLPGFQATALPGANFQGSTLHGASLQGTTHARASLQGTHLQGPNIHGYPIGALSRPGTAQDHGPPQPSRITSPSLNPVVVSTINIKDVCCLGIAKQASLPLSNPGPRWLQCHIEVASININGEELPAHNLSSFLVKRSTIIAPHQTEEVKAVFVPHQPGSYIAQMLVSTSPVIAEGEVGFLSHGSTVTVLARAEKPNVEIKGVQNSTLDFGVLSYGKERSAPVYLVNKGYSTVPLRIHIKNLSQASSTWYSFQIHAGDKRSVPNSSSGLNLPTHATLEGQNDNVPLWVHFHSTQRDKTTSPSNSLSSSPEQILAKLEVWLDVPDTAMPVASATLRATVGLAKLNIPRSLAKEISLQSKRGEHTGRMLPLKNTGAIHLDVELEVVSPNETFSVVPKTVLLAPGQDVEVMIKYSPKGPPSSDTGVLKMVARPDGPSYEVTLSGEVAQKSSGSVKPNFLVNRHYISWGGVPIGRALQQKLTIRSCNKTETQSLKLCISGNKQDFQLLNTFKTGEWSVDESQYVTLHPMEDLQVHILYSPSAISSSQAKLNIKPQESNFKYSVPLSGYGGVSKLVVSTAQETEHGCYSLDVGKLTAHHNKTITATVSNVGRRCAFVKTLVFQDEQGRDQLSNGEIQVDPSEFLLAEGDQRTLTLTLKTDRLQSKDTLKPSSTLASVGLFYGDEVTRCLLRRALKHGGNEAISLSGQNPLRGIDFDQAIPGEAKVNEVWDIPWRSGDLNLFYRCISRLMLNLRGSLVSADPTLPPNVPANKTQVHPLSPVRRNATNAGDSVLVSASSSNRAMIVPYTPPVKGSRSSQKEATTALPNRASHPSHPPRINPLTSHKTSSESWILQPLQLVLTAPSASTGVQKGHSMVIANTSLRQLRFETMHTPDCLIVTPAAGVVEPGRELLVLVSCNPSIQDRGVQLPWSGAILVICDGLKKEVRVQIREDLGMDSSILPTTGRMESLPDQPITPDSSMVAAHSLASSPVKILSKVIHFPVTNVGSTSAATLEFQNRTSESRQWCLSSFAPTYVKQGSGEVCRATYTAFRFTHTFGQLTPAQHFVIQLEFIPRDEGAYSQYWDLESSGRAVGTGQSHRTRIELTGQGVWSQQQPIVSQKTKKKRKKKVSSDDTLVRVLPSIHSKNVNQPGPGDHSSEGDVSPEDGKSKEKDLSRSPDSKSIHGITLINDHLVFKETKVGEKSTLKVQVQNVSQEVYTLKFLTPHAPFYISHQQHTIQPNRFIRLPVSYKPTSPGKHQAALVIQTEGQHNLLTKLEGIAV